MRGNLFSGQIIVGHDHLHFIFPTIRRIVVIYVTPGIPRRKGVLGGLLTFQCTLYNNIFTCKCIDDVNEELIKLILMQPRQILAASL